MTKIQSVRLWIVSLTGIAILTLFWGYRSTNSGIALSEQTLQQSLDQELLSLSSAVQSSIQALQWQILDVTKAELSERQASKGEVKATSTFLNSNLSAIAFAENENNEWRLNWMTVTPQLQSSLTMKTIAERVSDWGLRLDEGMQFHRLPDIAGSSYFAVVTPMVRGTSKLIAVAIIQPSQLAIPLSAAQIRDVKVVNDRGYAVALSHPAYVGSSMRKNKFIDDLIVNDELSLKKQFKNELGQNIMAAGQRLAGSNLYVSIEAKMPATLGWLFKNWLFLMFSAAAAVALTWFTLKRFFDASLEENFELASQVEILKKQLEGTLTTISKTPPIPVEDEFIPKTVMAAPVETFESPAINESEGVDVGRVIRSAFERLEKKFSKVHVHFEAVGIDKLYACGDEVHLKTVLEEVLKNAFEAVSDATERTITVFGEKTPDLIRITVSDTGCGISAANLGKVFDPFFTTKEAGGVARGLGLNVVRRVIEELKGRVQIFSEGRGTRVEIELPTDFETGLPVSGDTTPEAFGMLDLDFEEIEKKAVKPLPRVDVRKPKVRSMD